MLGAITKKYHEINRKTKDKTNWSIYEFIILAGCISTAIIMIIRCFFSTELTDEAYYVADAKAMLEGNLPYAYCTYSYGSGSCFLLIPLLAIYRIFQPEFSGVFLYSRLCFVFMWYAILFVIYKILCKNIKRCHLLLFIWVLIPYKPGLTLWNFSYNTVPSALMLLVAVLLYDVIENKSAWYIFKIMLSGFISGIAFLAQPGYGLAIVVFCFLLLTRSIGGKFKIINLFLYGLGGIAEVCVVYIPIIAQVGFATTLNGVSRYFNGYPSNTTMSTTTPLSRILSVIINFRQFVILFLLLLIVIYILAKRYVRENEQKLLHDEYIYIGIVSAECLFVCSFMKSSTHSESISYMLGIIGTIVFGSLLIFKAYKKQIILMYIGFYPILFAVGEAAVVDSGNTIGRFTAAVPTIAICLLFFMEEKSEIVRLISVTTAILCAVELSLNVGSYVYRDAAIIQLQYRVEEGVYKGLYTTKARANDLPDLEVYLNRYISDEETYEFHDLAPYGYLMMHRGKPLSIATWDSMNYSYGKNAPAENYEYYRRRQAIPNKIFYVDYGNDDRLSIEDPNFMYNEFVETYYEKVDEVKLNDTFFHIIVYEYKGGFNGEWDYWINRHMVLPNS